MSTTPYLPGLPSREYHRLPRSIRESVRREVDRLFREQTGITRPLHPTSLADIELRRTWLRLRDQVMGKLGDLLEAEIGNDKHDDTLTGIPDEMRWHRWEEGARLLETWFERPPAVAPAYSAPVTDVIRMDWVLTFARAKAVYDAIFRDRIWANDAARQRLLTVFRVPTGAPALAIGDLSKPVLTLDTQWINVRSVANGTAVDGLAAALGNFNFHMVLAGKAQRRNALEFTISVEEIGVYAKDSVDFEGDQFLGVWGTYDAVVTNADFRDWRNRHHAGGDFRVFSDLKRTRLAQPDVLTVQVP